jgi:hypothetical protein
MDRCIFGCDLSTLAEASALAAKQATSEKGQANGYAGLGADGKVPSAQLPAGTGGLTLADVIDALWPVGSLYTSTLSTNPGTLLGRGTWTAFAAGRVMIGHDSGDTDFDTGEETGGSKTKAISAHAGTAVADHGSHTHTYSQVPNHVHGFTDLRGPTTGGATTTRGVTEANDASSTATGLKTANPDGGVAQGTTNGPSATLSHSVTQPSDHSALNVLPPFVVIYAWKRTA